MSLNKKTSVLGLLSKKKHKEKITAVIAFDYLFSRLADEAGVDIIIDIIIVGTQFQRSC